MKYFYIRNSGSLNRRLLELIGLSTKRDRAKDNAVIGNKGSGSKLAAVAALRLKIDTGITSNDENGSYFLEFDSEEISVDGIIGHQVYYHYYLGEHDEKGLLKRVRFPSSMVTEAFPDWDKPIGADKMCGFKALREHVCNAYDADKHFTWGVCDTRTFAVSGETRVYLDNTEEFRAIFEVPERYFKFLSAHVPYAVMDGVGEIWPKSENGTTRLFLLGVLVDCDTGSQRASLFDYSLYDKAMLSEERILKHASAYAAGIGRIFAKLSDVDLCRAVLRGILAGKGKLEAQALGTIHWSSHMSDEAKTAWLQAAHELLGEKIALPSDNEVANSDASQMYGHTVIRAGDGDFHDFLKTIGVPNADDVFPRNPEDRIRIIRFDELEEESQRRFMVAFTLFAKHFPDRVGYPIYFFEPLDEAMRRMGGFAGSGDYLFKEIQFQVKTPTTLPVLATIIKRLIHESRHCKTKKYDHERDFVEAAEQDVLAEILRQASLTAGEDGKPISKLNVASAAKPVFGEAAKGKAVRKPAPAQSLEEIPVTEGEEVLTDETTDTVRTAISELIKDIEAGK